MCFEKAAKRLSLSLGSFSLADDFCNFTSFFIERVKGSQVLGEIKLVPFEWNSAVDGETISFSCRLVCPSQVRRERGAWLCSSQLWCSHSSAVWHGLLGSQPSGPWAGAGRALGMLTHFSPQDWMAYCLKGRVEPTQLAPTLHGWPGKGAAHPEPPFTLKKSFATQPGEQVLYLVPFDLEVREGQGDKLGWRVSSIVYIILDYLPYPETFILFIFLKPGVVAKKKMVEQIIICLSTVEINTLVFIYRALYKASQSKYFSWSSFSNTSFGLTFIPTRPVCPTLRVAGGG